MTTFDLFRQAVCDFFFGKDEKVCDFVETHEREVDGVTFITTFFCMRPDGHPGLHAGYEEAE